MQKNTENKISRRRRGIRLINFIIFWLMVCSAAASSVIYADEIRQFAGKASEMFADFKTRIGSGFKNKTCGEPDTAPNVFFAPDAGSEADSGPQEHNADDTNGAAGAVTDDKKTVPNENKANDMPASGASDRENTESLYEELKKPIMAFCSFLENNAAEYFYEAIPPDCIEFLKDRYADAIFLMGGENNALKLLISNGFADVENSIGKLESVSCRISEISAVNEKELSEIENNLIAIGLKQKIERAVKMKLTFCMEGEKGSVNSERVIRLVKIGADWFINPCDLTDTELIK